MPYLSAYANEDCSVFESYVWTAEKHTNTKVSRYYRSKTTPLIQKLVKESLTGDEKRKTMVCCLQQTRAEHTLVRTVEKVLQGVDMDPYAVESFTGRRAKKNEAVPDRTAERSRFYPSGANFYFRGRRRHQLKVYRRRDIRRPSVQQVR
mmetsp:Transcript_8521/g.19236  ORF Transcript_8521/g.19236 Transcript_8521/m.19236 type:complete len:149 (-) Transcript_8521:1177-1623(-)